MTTETIKGLIEKVDGGIIVVTLDNGVIVICDKCEINANDVKCFNKTKIYKGIMDTEILNIPVALIPMETIKRIEGVTR